MLTTGGTIDKVYFDALSEYEIGEPTVPHIFREAGVRLAIENKRRFSGPRVMRCDSHYGNGVKVI